MWADLHCVLPVRMANEAIKRERHPTPTVDDLIHNFNGATVFSKLDLRSGYHQIPLAPESLYITTFATHKGLRRYARLNFGTSSASEMFQDIISEQVRDIPGVFNISDDVIVFGKTQANHDELIVQNSSLTSHNHSESSQRKMPCSAGLVNTRKLLMS